eukprot:CAMPEP_0204375194 /NCGR_PEP_ID=MMETSP0469-20131031/49070_1 /ASSEMBLY_ACC=CAM_ASM_000384 /TAXON_ID=2969 /ORGANISM="Oxyrrhis marina" /LENGTH=101 /DNA_ID=CAMNT_0051365847 /DNA_START=652 /DNA_END=957 /DNA_ORIENTATION=-
MQRERRRRHHPRVVQRTVCQPCDTLSGLVPHQVSSHKPTVGFQGGNHVARDAKQPHFGLNTQRLVAFQHATRPPLLQDAERLALTQLGLGWNLHLNRELIY